MLQQVVTYLRTLISPRARQQNQSLFDTSAPSQSEKFNSDEAHSGAGDCISPRRKLRSERLPFTQWADVSKTERFIRIVPLSGYRLVQHEYDAYAIYLEPHASDEALGRALLDTLERSRFIPPRPAFSEAEKYMRYYWQKDFTQRYKSKREEYKNMDWCRAKRSGGRIEIHPHQRDMPEYFLDHPPDKTVVIPADGQRRGGRSGGAPGLKPLRKYSSARRFGVVRCRRLIRQRYLWSAGGRRQSAFDFTRKSLRAKIRRRWARGVFQASHRVWRLAGNSWS